MGWLTDRKSEGVRVAPSSVQSGTVKVGTMGYYINPKGMEKEEWLAENGMVIPRDGVLCTFEENTDSLPVCLVTNPGFTAAAIAYDEREAVAFLREDGRRKVWYRVTKAALKPFYDGGSHDLI
jgi:hypothetical protein